MDPVIRPGSKVMIAGLTPGIVLAVTIRAGGVSCYEVAWWNGNTRQTAWVEPHELEVEQPRPEEIYAEREYIPFRGN